MYKSVRLQVRKVGMVGEIWGNAWGGVIWLHECMGRNELGRHMSKLVTYNCVNQGT